jgi:hypothetical protein
MLVRPPPLHRLLTLFLTVQLTLQFTEVGFSIADETPEMAPLPINKPTLSTPSSQPESVLPENGYFKEKINAIEHNIDEVHDTLEEDILHLTIRLDDFFGNLKAESKPTGYRLSWSNSIRDEIGGGLKFGSALRANVVLSKISDRLRLSLSGENKPEPLAASIPEDPGNPGFNRTAQTTKIVNAELRYELFRTQSTDIFLGAGFRLVIPLEAFVRNRYQYAYHINDISLVRVEETFFMNSASGVGETTEVSLERSLGQHTLLRWANTGTVSQEFKGLEWGTDLSLTHELSSRNAITIAGGIFGNTGLDDEISNYRILARYRQNFFRSWLFYELVPEISWPRGGDGAFSTKYAITFLVEVVLQGVTPGIVKK